MKLSYLVWCQFVSNRLFQPPKIYIQGAALTTLASTTYEYLMYYQAAKKQTKQNLKTTNRRKTGVAVISCVIVQVFNGIMASLSHNGVSPRGTGQYPRLGECVGSSEGEKQEK